MLKNSSDTSMSKQPLGGQRRFLTGSQMPEKSGLPSAALGVGAFKSGAPAGVRGTPEVGYFSHCADRSWPLAKTTARTRQRVLMGLSKGRLPGDSSSPVRVFGHEF